MSRLDYCHLSQQSSQSLAGQWDEWLFGIVIVISQSNLKTGTKSCDLLSI